MSKTASTETHPYGVCECPQPTGMCCGGTGPAAYAVTRAGKRLNVCTRCDLSTDTERVLLIRMEDETVDVFRVFDAMGFFCILAELAEQRKEALQ